AAIASTASRSRRTATARGATTARPRRDHGVLVLSKIGRLAVRWSRPLAGTPKTVTIPQEAGGGSVAISCAEGPSQPSPRTGQETGIDLGLDSFATLCGWAPARQPA
ncbi:MAG TPA: hypothetical protein VGS80_19520, partial [Ktedonobacterales bacterium]|nr:hypothetical protein [Ktedonobacterales bacterium]